MDSLKKLLTSDNNLASMPTLISAYQETLVDLQLDLWQRIGDGMSKEFGNLEKESIVEQSKQERYSGVKNYVENKRNSMYCKIKVQLNGYDDVYLIVEQEHYMYFGVYCKNGKENLRYEEIMSKTRKIPHTEAWGDYGVSAYAQPEINFKHLSSDNLAYLSKQENRQEYADCIVNGLRKFVDVLECDE